MSSAGVLARADAGEHVAWSRLCDPRHRRVLRCNGMHDLAALVVEHDEGRTGGLEPWPWGPRNVSIDAQAIGVICKDRSATICEGGIRVMDRLVFSRRRPGEIAKSQAGQKLSHDDTEARTPSTCSPETSLRTRSRISLDTGGPAWLSPPRLPCPEKPEPSLRCQPMTVSGLTIRLGRGASQAIGKTG